MAVTARDKAESTYRRLKELVINYRFRPGEPLSAVSISDRLQVSATPVREALARLHGENLVDLVQNRGFFAKTLNAKTMKDHYEFAFQISVYAIERGHGELLKNSIEESEPTLISSSGGINDKSEGFFDTYVKLIEELYIQVAALTKNQVMLDAIHRFNDQTRFVRLLDLEAESNFHEIAADMSALIKALKRQDVAAAIANLRRQRDKKLARMNDLVSEGIARSLKQSS